MNLTFLRLMALMTALSGMVAAGGSAGISIPYVNTPQTRQAYAEATRLLRQGNLPQARQIVVDVVTATAARLPPCVTTQNFDFGTNTYFPLGEALRFYQTVPGGRVNYYELRPDGAYRIWQAVPKEPKDKGSGKTVASRVFGVDQTDMEQCGHAPNDRGTLAFYNDVPFNADFRYGFLKPNGERVVVGDWQVKQNLGEIRQRGLSIFHILPGETVKH